MKRRLDLKCAASKRKRHAQHGNYASYYGYRHICGSDQKVDSAGDPRVKAMPADWFTGLRVLDVGCNSGQVTIEVGMRYKPLEIIGVDIDRSLVAKARQNLTRVVTAGAISVDASTSRTAAVPSSVVEWDRNGMAVPIAKELAVAMPDGTADQGSVAGSNIFFRRLDVMCPAACNVQMFNTILWSVFHTKYISAAMLFLYHQRAL